MKFFNYRLIFSLAWYIWIVFSISEESFADQTLTTQVTEHLRNRIEAAGNPPRILIGKEVIHASDAIPNFYEQRNYRPAWSNNNGPLSTADNLIDAIRQADQEGLSPCAYHLVKIESLLKEVKNEKKKRLFSPAKLTDLDLLLTDAFFVYGSHLVAGCINPETIDFEWSANRREADLANLATILHSALEQNQIEKALKNLLPQHKGYTILEQTLSEYREIAKNGGWQKISSGHILQKGDRDNRIRALRKRLSLFDLSANSFSKDDFFDNALEESLRGFQKRHGLKADGIVGPATLAELNVPVEDRIRQIELNMERWRWLPHSLGNRYILVNIADFELSIIQNNQVIMTMRVIVGRDYRQTPVFSDRITYLVFNPYWHIPPKIAVQDLLPLTQKNPNYLEKEKIRIFDGWGAEAKEIDPKSVNWSQLTAKSFPYRLRQEPGPHNALGRIKFMFPNKYNVYLHDTPSRELFFKTERTFSSGCIRVEKPVKLAEYLLKGDPKWTPEKILSIIDTNVEQTVRLPESVPIHLLYWTAWAEEDGTIHFRKDIYGRDKKLAKVYYNR